MKEAFLNRKQGERMPLAEMLKKIRKEKGVSSADLAKKLSVPVDIIAYLEDPVSGEKKLIELLSKALEITPQIFTGEVPLKPKEPTEEEKRAAAVKSAKFPHIRQFILDPQRCENAVKASELFGAQPLSLPEKNVILYLSTTALYHFCDTNTSSFSFDRYLFKLHGILLAEFEKALDKMGLSAQEKDDRLGNARSNIFATDSMENIAIRVVDQFAEQLEKKLADNRFDFEEDLNVPFKWGINETLMKIEIKDTNGVIKDYIKLLDVKERD